jgi:uncharacterized protein YebE (UPF0316 family)
MFDLISLQPWAFTILIFLLRVVGMSMDTLRVLFVLRGSRLPTWILGFLQTTLWVVAIGGVLSNLNDLWNVIAYCAGFATGNVVGLAIEERLAIGYVNMRIISPGRGSAILETVRTAGYGATEIPGRGKDGTVTVIDCSIKRRHISKIQKEISRIDPEAFVTIEETRPLHRGYWRA